MQRPLRPPDERQRLDTLRQYQLLDTPAEPAFDDLTALAAHICGTPISLISIVDEERQWFKSKFGLSVAETPRDVSFCGHVILQPDLFIVPDTELDPRFADNPLVTGAEHIRFYAGAPLVARDGHRLGTLCLMDRVPRHLEPEQEETLRVLGQQVMAQLELRRQAHELRASEARLRLVTDNARVGLVIMNKERRYIYANEAYAEILGLPSAQILGAGVADVLASVYNTQIRWRLDRAFAGERVSYELHWPRGTTDAYYEVRYEPTTTDGAPLVVVVITDVTEQKAAAIASHRLAAMVESSDDAIIGKDVNGVVTSWNKGAEGLFGHSANEMVGSSILELIPADRHDEETVILGRIRRGEGVAHFETQRLTKDRRVVDVSITSSPIRDSDGTIIGASKVVRDIGERKRTEAVLREREEQLRLYAEHSPLAVAMLDRDMRYLVVSRRWMEDYRLAGQSIIGRSHYEVFPEIPQRWVEIHRRCLAGAIEKCDEDPFSRADGSIDWIRWEIRPWHKGDGSIGGVIIFSEDISQRKATDAALRAAEERMRFALRNAEIGIWDIDYQTGTVRWSEILEEQCGLQPGTFAGTFDAFIEAVHPDDRSTVIEIIEGATKTGAEFTLQYRIILPDGKVRWFNGAGRIHLGPHGEPLRGVGIAMDVTGRRTLEAQYQQAQKMEAVGRLAGGIAHDFNNLLTVILGHCELLMAEINPKDQIQADLLEIQKAGASAATLTRQLLAFSRKQIIEPTRLNLNDVVTDLRGMLGRLIGEDVAIVLALRAEEALFTADRGQVEQILLNLVVNARDAMPNGGTLTIETALVELDEHYAAAHFDAKPGIYVALTISDTGTGMTDEVQAHLFEPFFTTKELGKGTGLGLATVHGIVTRFGGIVGVYSEFGRGTSFKVYFPAEGAAAPLSERTSAVQPSGRHGHTVLVVEDEDGLRELTRRFLKRQGFRVLVAANAKQALDVFEENPSIDVLLTDVVMPGNSGPELTRQLIDQHPGLRVVYMSGYTEEAIVQHGVLKPGIAFLHKPFTSDALGRKIVEALGRY